MTGKEATDLSGRSETWLRNHSCVWCEQTLWRALTTAGCGALFSDRCDPTKKDFSHEAQAPGT
jgi:hypothetical protein